jgi:hypothetical protein
MIHRNQLNTTIRTIAVCLSLFATTLAAQPASAACSNGNLNGAYGYLSARLDGNATTGTPFAFVGRFVADGQGTITSGSETANLVGHNIGKSQFAGLYSISENCTGSMTLGGRSYNIVLHDNDTAFQMTAADQGSLRNGFGYPVGRQGCGLSGTQTYATNLLGYSNTQSLTDEAAVGQLVVLGSGKLTGTETISVAFEVQTSVPLTGTYTPNADCTGTLQIVPQQSSGLPTMNFSTVAVNNGTELLLVSTDTGTEVGGTAQQ